MYADAWDILEIEPTTDKKIIQKAYAEKLKKYHPEEHPDEFQKLQVAYRTASEYARTGEKANKKEYSNKNIEFQSVKRCEPEKNIWKPVNTETEPEKAVKKYVHNDNAEWKPVNIETEPEKPVKKYVHTDNTMAVWEPQYQEREKKEDTEPVPDYIAGIQNTNTKNLYEESYGEYIYILQKKLIGQGTDNDLRELEELFRDNRFCHVLGEKKFRLRFIDAMNYHKVWNKKALKFLLSKMQELMNDNPNINEDFIELKRYLENGRGIRKSPPKEITTNKWNRVIPVLLMLLIPLRSCNEQLEKESEQAYRSSSAQEAIDQYLYEEFLSEQVLKEYAENDSEKETESEDEIADNEEIEKHFRAIVAGGDASYCIYTLETIPELKGMNDERISLSIPEFNYNDLSQGNKEIQSLINKEMKMAALGDHLDILMSEELSDLEEYEVDYVIEKSGENLCSMQFQGNIHTHQYIHNFARGITINILTGEKIPIENYMKIDENLLVEIEEGKKAFESNKKFKTKDMIYDLQTFIADYENGLVDSYTCYFLDGKGINLIVPVQGGNTDYFFVVNK